MTARALQLHELAPDLAAIEDQIIEAEGEITPAVAAQLDALGGAFDAKVERLLLRALQLNFEGGVAKVEAARIAKLASVREQAALRLKQYVLNCMQVAGREKVETSRLRARIQANSRPTIEWTGAEDTIPEDFRRVRIVLDGTKAYESWRAQSLPDGFVVTQGKHLRVT